MPLAVRRRAVGPMLLAAAVVVLLGACGGPEPQAVPTTAASPTPAVSATPSEPHKPERVPGKVMLGSYLGIKDMTYADGLTLRRQQLGRDLRIFHWYYGFWDGMPTTTAGLPDGAIVLLSWAGTFYAPIIDGTYDDVITAAADRLAALRQPVFLRWAWEMNGNWYDWGGARNGNDPAAFIQAWRHIHDIFAEQGADNVAWVWSPNGDSVPEQQWNDMDKYYPGDDYVDWVAISAYSNGSYTPERLFGEITRAYGPRKPIMLAETGIEERGGTVKPDFIRALRQWIKDTPAVGALVWFDTNDDKGTGHDWRIDTSAAALAAYRELATDPYFTG